MKFNETDRRNAKKLADDLECAFSWADSPQGEDYWLRVSENLYDISQPKGG